MNEIYFGPWKANGTYIYFREVLKSPVKLSDGTYLNLLNLNIWFLDDRYYWRMEYTDEVYEANSLEEAKRNFDDYLMNNDEYKQYWGENTTLIFLDENRFDKLRLLI